MSEKSRKVDTKTLAADDNIQAGAIHEAKRFVDEYQSTDGTQAFLASGRTDSCDFFNGFVQICQGPRGDPQAPYTIAQSFHYHAQTCPDLTKHAGVVVGLAANMVNDYLKGKR